MRREWSKGKVALLAFAAGACTVLLAYWLQKWPVAQAEKNSLEVVTALATLAAAGVALWLGLRDARWRREKENSDGELARLAVIGDLESLLPLLAQVYRLIQTFHRGLLQSEDVRQRAICVIQTNGGLMATPSIEKVLDRIAAMPKGHGPLAIEIWSTVPMLARRCCALDSMSTAAYRRRESVINIELDIRRVANCAYRIFENQPHRAMDGLIEAARQYNPKDQYPPRAYTPENLR